MKTKCKKCGHEYEKVFANCIYNDPPYNIGLNYSRGVNADQNYSDSKVNDRKKPKDFESFIDTSIKNAIGVAHQDYHIYYWCDETNIGLIQTLYKMNMVKNERVCMWIKNNFNPRPQTAFNKVYESCVYGTSGKPYLNPKFKNLNEILNKEIESGNQVHDEINEIFNIWIAKRVNSDEYEHPTQKPLDLHEKPLKRTTKVGDIVLDLFGGSGSTLLACEQLKRRARLMEIDPIYCQVIINRWETYTGNKAKKI